MASVEQFTQMLREVNDDTLIMIQSVLIMEIASRNDIIEKDIAIAQATLDILISKRNKFLP